SRGTGLERSRCLRGGIDAWAQKVDTQMPRNRLGYHRGPACPARRPAERNDRSWVPPECMESELEKKVREALQNPQNMGEMADSDAIGTVGNTPCGEMLRMWIKVKE